MYFLRNGRLGVFALACFFLLLGCGSILSSTDAAPIDLVVGTYNKKGSEGVYTVQYHRLNHRFSEPKLVARADNPSFVATTERYWYVVNEIEPGQLSMYRRQGDSVNLEKTVNTGGASPCYLSLNPAGDQLATANYMGGNVSIFSLVDGVLEGPPRVLNHEGSGPDVDRQEAPHAHWVQWHPSNQWIYTVDLGADTINLYSAKTLQGRSAITMLPGDGPRHMVWHPQKPLAYVLNELSNSLAILSVNPDGTLTELSRVDTLPTNYDGHSQAAHIAINRDGTRVYVSNRGHNSIAVFDTANAEIAQLLQHQATGGNWPRHFSLVADESLLMVANQESNNLTVLSVKADGRLASVGATAKVIQPTFVGAF